MRIVLVPKHNRWWWQPHLIDKQEEGILEVLSFPTPQRNWSQSTTAGSMVLPHLMATLFNSRWAILSLSFILHSKEVQRSPHCCNRNDEMTIMTYRGNRGHENCHEWYFHAWSTACQRQPIAVSYISIYICLIDISFRSKSKEQLNERRAGLSSLS